MLQFIPNDFRNENPFEQRGQDFDLVNQDKVIQGTGIGDNQLHRPLKSKPPKVISIPIQVTDRKRKIDLVGLEQCIQGLGRRQPEQTTQFPLREPPQSKFLDAQRFKDASRQVASSPKPGRKIVGDMNGYIHPIILPRRKWMSKKRGRAGETPASGCYRGDPTLMTPEE